MRTGGMDTHDQTNSEMRCRVGRCSDGETTRETLAVSNLAYRSQHWFRTAKPCVIAPRTSRLVMMPMGNPSPSTTMIR